MSGSEGDDSAGDGGLSANRFGLEGEIPDSGDDLSSDAGELEIDCSEQVARQWETPKGEWWP